MTRVGLLLLLLAPTLLRAQTDTAASIRVNVNLVNVFVNVTDSNGEPVAGLTKANFSLSEDGHPQKLAVFEQQSDLPLSIVLAIDTSGSVRKDLAVEQHAAHQFVHALLRPIDQLELLDFNSKVRQVVPFTSEIKRIDRGLDHLDTGPATALYSAVYLAAQGLEARSGRKVLVLISDGGNTVEGVDYPQALEQAVRAQAMVYSIIDVPVAADAGRDTGGEHAMITLSQETGGRYYYADSGHLEQAFQKVSQDLRTQYLLGYYPAPRAADSNFRALSVKLKNLPPNAHYSVRNRTGYYASPSR